MESTHKSICQAEEEYIEIYDEEWDDKDPLDLSKKFIVCKVRCEKCGEIYLKKIPLIDF